MPTVTLNPADVQNAQIGINLPVLYGYGRAQGNEVLNHSLANKNKVVVRILCEGEIDGIERIFINSAASDPTNTSVVHFHPGTDAVLGAGLTPISTGRQAGSAPGNLILNGDGESGAVGSQAPGWFVLGGFSGIGLLTANDFVNSGSRSLKIINTAAQNSPNLQYVELVGGVTYVLQGWIKTTAITGGSPEGALLNMNIVGGIGSFSILTKNGNYDAGLTTLPTVGLPADNTVRGFTFVQSIFTPQQSGLAILLCQLFSSNACSAWFDDVQVYAAEQAVDSFWSLLPANFQPTTLSRKAYLMLNVPPDPAAPSDTLTVVTDLRGCKVRQFDGSGNQIGYAFSTNGAEQVLDAILRTMIKPEWNTLAASAVGGDLVAAEKARINFTAFAESVAWCNQVISTGQKRFESSLAIVNQTSMMDALTQLCMMSQLYITEAAGQIYILPDQPRTSTFILKSDHVVPGSTAFDKINLHGAQNRYIANFNDLNAQDMADIDTPANNALSRNGGGQVTVLFKTAHPFSVGQNIVITPPQDGSDHDTGFDGIFPVASIPASNKITYFQSGNSNSFEFSEQFDNAAWVKASGVTVTPNTTVDPLGGNTADSITSSVSGIGLVQQTPRGTIANVQFTMSVWLRAAAPVVANIQIASSPAGNLAAVANIESVNVTLTTQWQRFSFTHSGSWTIGNLVQGGIFINAGTIFAWGAQIEDGTQPTAYRQTTNAVSGIISGNGTCGTPESRFAVRQVIVNHEQHQQAIGQRGLGLTPIFRVVPVTLDLGNNTWERVNRILNFMIARNLGIPTTPYLAPFTGEITCFMDAADLTTNPPRLLVEQLCGDIITIDSTVSEEYQGDYEIKQAVYTIPGTDNSSSGGDPQSQAPTMALTLLQYLPAAFSDSVVPGQALRASAPGHVLPIGIVDPSGNPRLGGAFKNNPVDTNGTLTGNNPLSQSGTSSTIIVAAFTMQFGDGQVSYNSGSVNPGSVGTWLIYCLDPNFNGGAVVYLATQSTHIKTSNNGIVVVGTITTSSGGGAVGAGGGVGAGDGFGGGQPLPTR